jgi:hypothetical protein
MVMGNLVMGDWNLGSSPFSSLFRDLYAITDDEIKRAHKETLSKIYVTGPYQALLAYMQKNGKAWRDVAPSPPFNRGQVHRWQDGQNRPGPDSIARIKCINQIADAEIPTPSPEEADLAACAATLTIIRDRRRPAPGPPHQPMNLHLYRALEFTLGGHPQLLSKPKTLVRDQVLTAIAWDISRTIPAAGIRTLSNLEHVLQDWAAPYVFLAGVLGHDEEDV